jgi:dipeptidyl aminopeptidase/acylaminoacyl peptidase
VYADDPSIAPDLLACLDLEWFFARPAPTPTSAATVGLGRLAIAQQGDLLIKGLPEGVTASLAHLMGITNVSFASQPRLSPSGEWLAFRLNPPDGWVFVQQVIGPGSYDLEDTGPLGLYAWSPVEDRLAYVAGQGELKLTGDYGSEPRTLVPQSGERQITSLAWSPDGAWIAYTVGESPYLDLWKVPLDGGEPVELYAATDSTLHAGLYRLLGWAPDGESLLVWEGNPYASASVAADGLPLASIPAQDGEPVRLAGAVLLYDDFVRPDPSGSGRVAVILGSLREATVDKVLYIFEGEGRTAVSPDGYAAASPAWSPDGRFLIYVAMPEFSRPAGGEPLRQALMGRKLWLYDLESGDSRQLTSDPAYRDEYPLWSADGKTLLYARMDAKDEVSLWLLSIDSGEIRMVMEGLSAGGQGWSGYYGHIAWYEMLDLGMVK